MLSVDDKSQADTSELKLVASLNMSVISTALDVAQPSNPAPTKDEAPLNMAYIPVTFDTSQDPKFLSNCSASKNILDMLLLEDTSHPDTSPLKIDASKNMSENMVTLDTSQDSKPVPVNLEASLNIPSILVAFPTFHVERSVLNLTALTNMNLNSSTLPTSQY